MSTSSSTSSVYLKKRNACDKISDKENINHVSPKHLNQNQLKSPPQSPVRSNCLSPQQFSWTRERNLEKEIDDLQEKLKDTEERFQSLRLQHDTLTDQHRILKENQTQFQEETEKLKLEVQHLSECANVLRYITKLIIK